MSKKNLPRDARKSKAGAAGMAHATAGRARVFKGKKDILEDLNEEASKEEIEEGLEMAKAKENCVVVLFIKGCPSFWTTGTSFSTEYPNATLLSESAAIGTAKSLRTKVVLSRQAAASDLQVIKDYGLASEVKVWTGE